MPVALLVFVLDRVTKAVVQASLTPGQHVQVLGDLLWVDYARNTGIAFSLARSHGSAVFIFDVVAILFIIYLALNLPPGETWMPIGLGLVLGGAVGNALDRVLAGAVTDFIDFRVFPVFNVADMGITVGAAVLAWRLYRGSRTEETA
ncbi:MAG: signal peptidase II [Candidatus Dormibacteria bacterium]